MKGLLTKDFCLLKVQKQFFLIFCGIAILFTFTNPDSTFAMMYISIMLVIFAGTSISYDEYDNGGAYLFSLPITRKMYVIEKYVFGLILGVGALLLTSIFTVVLMLAKQSWIGIGEFFFTLVVYFATIVLMLSLVLPVQLKFGNEKSRMALMGIVLAIFIVIYAGAKLADMLNVDVEAMLMSLSGMKEAVIAVGIFLLVAVILVVSCVISIKIMEKKEY